MNKYSKKLIGGLVITVLVAGSRYSLHAVEAPEVPEFVKDLKSYSDLSIEQLSELIAYLKANQKYLVERDESHPEGRLLSKKEILKSDKTQKAYESSLIAMRRYIQFMKSANLRGRSLSSFWAFIPSLYSARITLFNKQINLLKEQGADPDFIAQLQLLRQPLRKYALPGEIESTALDLSNVELKDGKKFKLNDEYTAKEIYRFIREGKKATEYNGQFTDEIKQYLLDGIKNNEVNPKHVHLGKNEDGKDIVTKVTLLNASRYVTHVRKKLNTLLTEALGENKVESEIEEEDD